MQLQWIGLSLAFASALVTNTAYSLEHDAAAAMPPLSPRRPFRSVRLLVRNRHWMLAFGGETFGWLLYVAALRLAPLALVQAVTASGVGVLAVVTARGHPGRLSRGERTAVVLAIVGLVMLALSLLGRSASIYHHPPVIGVVVWMAACAGGAIFLIVTRVPVVRAAALGLAAGLLLADGDVSAKLIGYGGWWLLALVPLVAAYGIGTSVLQSAYQRGDALTAAGTATLVTNAIPIAAGFVLFGEVLPSGARTGFQLAAFTCLVLSAVALGHRQTPQGQAASGQRGRGQQVRGQQVRGQQVRGQQVRGQQVRGQQVRGQQAAGAPAIPPARAAEGAGSGPVSLEAQDSQDAGSQRTTR